MAAGEKRHADRNYAVIEGVYVFYFDCLLKTNDIIRECLAD